MTYAEYLALEESSETRYEFIRGDVYAMSGGTPTHAGLQVAVSTVLMLAVRGRPCRVFSSDLSVRVEATDATFHPDVTVVCGKLETSATDPNAVVNPKVIVEVLSDSTEAYDRGAKAGHYRQIPSLAEYVLVAQNERLVEVHRKNERGKWELSIEARDGEIELSSVGARFTVEELYADPLEQPR